MVTSANHETGDGLDPARDRPIGRRREALRKRIDTRHCATMPAKPVFFRREVRAELLLFVPGALDAPRSDA